MENKAMSKEENMPLVTVCIPAYNHEKYVAECIESVINQDYKNIELIIINDGSKDNTDEVIKKYIVRCKERFIRFEYINRENKGLTKTLNEMIDLSSGEYIKFIASDDILNTKLISQSIQFFNNNQDIEILLFNLDKINESGNIIEKNISGLKGLNKDIKDIKDLTLEKALEYNRFFGPAHIEKKSLFNEIGKFDENILVEDWEFFLRAIFNKINIGYLNSSLVYYREHDSNSWKRTNYILKHNMSILNIYAQIPKHKNRLIGIFANAINSFYHHQNYTYEDSVVIKDMLKRNKLSLFSILLHKPKTFIKYLYISLNLKRNK